MKAKDSQESGVTIHPIVGALMPMLVFSKTPQERLLGLGKILIVLPKVPAENRRAIQAWIRGSFDGAYIQLAHRFALASPAYILKCLLEEPSLEIMSEELTNG